MTSSGKADTPRRAGGWRGEALWAVGLLLTPFVFLPSWMAPGVFPAGLDLSNIHLPLHEWMHSVLKAGRLPLITDLAGHGAPVAGLSIAGLLSPVFWTVHRVASSPGASFQFLLVAPFFLLLSGSWSLGRSMGLSRHAAALLALLLAYHGRNMAQLDHPNLLWGHAFLPWILLCLKGAMEGNLAPRAAGAGFLLSLGLLSGHPQMVFLQLLFVPFFLYGVVEGGASRKTRVLTVFAAGFLLFSAPFLLHTAETLFFDSPDLSWSASDVFYHSWTPLNFVTLLFPAFFGRTAIDGTSDYWWQYQYVEMQAALSIAGLFFALLFFLQKDRRRIPLLVAALLFLYLSMGKFSLLYRGIQHLPLVGAFRDPARYGYPAFWTLSLAAAFGWDRWCSTRERNVPVRWLAAALLGLSGVVVAGIALLSGPLRGRLESLGLGLVRRWILSDPTHPHRQDLSYYVQHVPEKIAQAARNCDLTRPEVLLPLLITAVLLAVVWGRPRGPARWRQGLLLFLVAADLWFFRTPAGEGRIRLSDIPSCRIPPTEGRMLSHASGTARPSLSLAREMAYPNNNLPAGRRTLDVVVGPSLPRYGDIAARLGWFSWVYRERKPFGFLDHPNFLRALGVDLCVSDVPIPVRSPLKTLSREFPYAAGLDGVRPRAILVQRVFGGFWPSLLDRMEGGNIDPLRDAFWDSTPDLLTTLSPRRKPDIREWTDMRVVVETREEGESFLVLQKSRLPAWKASVNGLPVPTFRCDGVLTGIPLPPGPCRIEMEYRPTGLRLGLFLSLLSLAALISLPARPFMKWRGPRHRMGTR